MLRGSRMVTLVGALVLVSLCALVVGQEACGAWDYADPDRDWPRLQCTSINQCDHTLWHLQSPVLVSSASPDPTLLPLSFSGYSLTTATISKIDRTVRLDFPSSTNALLNTHYKLVQAHLHVNEENVVGSVGQQGAVIHFVHHSLTNNSDIAVVALSLKKVTGDQSRTMPWLQSVFKALPLRNISQPITLLPLQDYFDQLKSTQGDEYYTYVGSLTTPPCTEGIRWFMLAQAEMITSNDIDLFLQIFGYNDRPIQRTLENVAFFTRKSSPPANNAGVVIGIIVGILLAGVMGFFIYKYFTKQQYQLVKFN